MSVKNIVNWLGFVVILVVIFGTIEVVTQQSERTAANYPQIQLAEDTAASLTNGSKPGVLTPGHVNMKRSLAPFVIIYSKLGQPISGNGYLNGRLPLAPVGILHDANDTAYYWVSWQPASDVRIASVTVAANNYYVLSGRSLKQIEMNENDTFWYSFAGGVISLLVLGVIFVLRQKIK